MHLIASCGSDFHWISWHARGIISRTNRSSRGHLRLRTLLHIYMDPHNFRDSYNAGPRHAPWSLLVLAPSPLVETSCAGCSVPHKGNLPFEYMQTQIRVYLFRSFEKIFRFLSLLPSFYSRHFNIPFYLAPYS